MLEIQESHSDKRILFGIPQVVFSVMVVSSRVIASDVIDGIALDRESLCSLLPRVNPETIFIREAPIWFQFIWGRKVAAIALPWGIYARPYVMARLRSGIELRRNARLIVHELVHIEQWRRFGVLRFVIRYFFDYMRGLLRTGSHWKAYRSVRTEVEARVAARLIVRED